MDKHLVIRAGTALASLCLAGAVLAQYGSAGTAGTAGQTATTERTPAKAERKTDAKIADADVRFLKQAAQNGHAELEASKLAQAKAQSAELKSFAQHMIDDHTKVADELKQLASSKGVELPSEPSMAQRAQLKLLSAADGDKFDRRYSDHFGIKAHEDTLRLFRNAADKATDTDVKAFAQKALPSLEKHLSEAKTMQASVAPGRRLGSGTQATDTKKADTKSDTTTEKKP